jgi:hypothetical protein
LVFTPGLYPVDPPNTAVFASDLDPQANWFIKSGLCTLAILQTIKTSVLDMAVLLSSNHARNQNTEDQKTLKSESVVKY